MVLALETQTPCVRGSLRVRAHRHRLSVEQEQVYQWEQNVYLFGPVNQHHVSTLRPKSANVT